MLIDIIVVILLVWGFIKGYRMGLVMAIFSFLAFFIGLAAAVKLSAFVADRISESGKLNGPWLPVLSFALVFIAVVLLVRLGGMFLQKIISLAFLGIINRLAGAILYALLYIFIFSVVLFYAEKLNLVKEDTRQASVTHGYVSPLGPKVIEGFGKLVPLFKGMFDELKEFFGRTVDSK